MYTSFTDTELCGSSMVDKKHYSSCVDLYVSSIKDSVCVYNGNDLDTKTMDLALHFNSFADFPASIMENVCLILIRVNVGV